MRRTFALVALAVASLAAAAVAALLRPIAKPLPVEQRVGSLRFSTQLDRRYLPESRATEAYLEIDLTAGGDRSKARRVPVNAVMILDRSGSMQGPKMERARDAARALVEALGEGDQLAIVEFSSDASVLLPSTPMSRATRALALAAIERLEATGGTNMSAAFDAAAPELMRGRGPARVDKVFLASDGQANEGISDRPGLLRVAQRDFGGATVSTFGMGEDYDEDLMSALAAQAGGRARYIQSPQVLPAAFRDELSRAAALAARDVRIRVRGLAGAAVERVLGYEFVQNAQDAEWVRLPDFAAGEERRVLVKLSVPPGHGPTDLASVELRFEDASGEERRAQAAAQATFTSDAGLLALAPGSAAVEGAKAEMAQLATAAAVLREAGRRDEARQQVEELKRVAMRAAAAVPAQARLVSEQAHDYAIEVDTIDAPGGAASKALKQKAFDAVRAPVAGW